MSGSGTMHTISAVPRTPYCGNRRGGRNGQGLACRLPAAAFSRLLTSARLLWVQEDVSPLPVPNDPIVALFVRSLNLSQYLARRRACNTVQESNKNQFFIKGTHLMQFARIEN